MRLSRPATGQLSGLADPDPGRLRLVATDLGLGLGVALLWHLGFEVASGQGWQPVDPAAWGVAGTCLGIAVAARRTASPWMIALLALSYPLVYFRPLTSSFHLMPLLVLGFAGAQQGSRRQWLVSAAAAAAAVAVLFSPVMEASSRAPADVLETLGDQPGGPPGGRLSPVAVGSPGVFVPPRQTDWSGLALAEFATVSVVLLGAASAAQRRVAAALAARNADLERLQRVEADRAVADERLRISRDLHDVVAHHLTAILMRAQAADRVQASRPQEAHDAVAWIAEESRDALRATRATISSLRDDGRPDPGSDAGALVADLGQIVERLGQVGLDARLDVCWEAEPGLAPSVGMAVRRVVQEALTNVLKHATTSEARISLRTVEGGLGIDVTDDGTAGGGPPSGAVAGDPADRGGTGLLSMQERLAACGGWLRYGPTEAGGWRVRLWVPALDRAGR